MPASTDFSADFVEPFLLLSAQRADLSDAEKADALGRLALLVEKNRSGLEKHTQEFAKMLEEATQRLPSEGLVMLAERVRQSEAAARELLYPWIDALQHGMSGSSNEGRQYIEQLLDISQDWLSLYHETRRKLLELAAQRRPAEMILHARPVEGENDHAALSREFMERFPKIRAALAK
jgi:hypothetical protein